MTTDERQRIARDYRDLAARFRDAAGDERRTREAAAIAARRFITARSDVPAFRELVEWGSGEPAVRWSGTDARAEARWAGRWQGIVQALAAHHPDRLPPMMPGADHYATACDLLADHAEDAYRAALVERAQAGVADALARADVDTSTLPVDPHAGELGTTATADDDFRSGQWFALNTRIPTARLRQAARPDRKTKRVRKQTIDGVECYSVSDARRWWESDMTPA